jgi:Tfp pilus assembly protein FimT
MLVVAIVAIVGTMAVLNVQTIMKNSRVDAAYDVTMSALRKARQAAIDERCVYIVNFNLPRTIVTQRVLGGLASNVSQISLPSDIMFRAETGIPNVRLKAPDQFGFGNNAIDFSVDYGGAGTQVYFQPDGSAVDSIGRINNGVVYLARPGELLSSRAVSLFGATGRIRGWRIITGAGGTTSWQ